MSKRYLIPVIVFVTLFGQFCRHGLSEQTVLMKFRTIRALPDRGSAIVILEDEKGERFLPIYIDENQALSIFLGQKGQTPTRPLTHDLLAKIFSVLDTRLEKVVITELRDGVYYADMILKREEQEYKLDSRPSDAIAMALRLDAPIYANVALLEKYETPSSTGEIIPQMTLHEWGFTVQELDEKLKKFFAGQEGVLISDVQPQSKAGAAGLQPGDLLQKINEVPIRSLKSFREALQRFQETGELQFQVLRDGTRLTITLPK